MNFQFQSQWRNTKLALPKLAKHVREKHTLSPPLAFSNPLFFSQSVSNPLALHPFFFLFLSLIIRQTHFFQINILLSLRAGRTVDKEPR